MYISRVRDWVSVLVLLSALPTLAAAQQTAASSNPDLDSQIESIRADARADKVAIITEAMKFTPQESAAFWPVYKKYEYDLSQLNNERVALIKAYADKYSTLTDADAKQMADKAFDFEGRRLELKKKYYKEFNKVLPATTVTKFFQLEHRLDLLVDLNIASNLPALLAKSGTTSSTSAAPQ